MKLAEVLQQMGATIARSDTADDTLILHLRFRPTNQAQEQAWQQALTRLLTAGATDWAVDVSRHYDYRPDAGGLVYLWRLIISGDSSAALRTLASPPKPRVVGELKEFPLGPGRLDYDELAARGATTPEGNINLKGAYTVNQGAMRVASAIAAGNPSNNAPAIGSTPHNGGDYNSGR